MVLADEEATNCLWILDSGTSRHIVYDPTLLYDAVDCEDSEAPKQADCIPLKVIRKGKVDLRVRVGHKDAKMTLKNVRLAPQLTLTCCRTNSCRNLGANWLNGMELTH